MADGLEQRPTVPAAVITWGRLLSLAAVLTLIGLGFRGPLALPAYSAGSVPAAAQAIAPTATAQAADPGGPALRSLAASAVEARHLRTGPPGPTGAMGCDQSGAPVPIAADGGPTPSPSGMTDRDSWNSSGCRGPPRAIVAI